MTFDMQTPSEHDHVKNYGQAIKQLKLTPEDRELQYQAVLSLARAGSLDFAISEYERYGLNAVSGHEDIMSLGGRLSKDLYLRTSDQTAVDHARSSAQQYAAAFQDTKGYYSGINAATMALVADLPQETVLSRVQAILDILPAPENLTASDHYFIEATRAECFLLRGDIEKTTESLISAITFDPLNYTAHAATVKQFRMILAKLKKDDNWLSPFLPPRPIHFAGHIWGSTSTKSSLELSIDESEAMAITISDAIQQHDIGFGYGALAAGSDILIAEALLSEGAELHIILPCNIDVYLERSVKPFGDEWVSRFQSCLKKASSLEILSNSTVWPDAQLNQFAGQFAMGQAVLRGQHFGVPAAQLLIWNQQQSGSHTSHHAADWQKTGRTQIIIPVKKKDEDAQQSQSSKPYSIVMRRSDTDKIETFETPLGAAKAALDIQSQANDIKIGLHVDIPSRDITSELGALVAHDIPHGILASEAFASLFVCNESDRFKVSFAGFVDSATGETLPSYSLGM
ncbi:TRAFs-binding domain-containing protein [Hellea sp.]|nr:TRAFs-binding domain-containing protein [Hellea sp.]